MRRERRLIWCEDRYQLLGQDGLDRYYGRTKGDFFFVYRKRGDSVHRAIIQVVEADLDWFWDSSLNRLVSHEPITTSSASSSDEVTREHVLRGYFNSKRIENLMLSSDDGLRAPMCAREIQLESGATAILLCPADQSAEVSRVREWIVSLHGGPESLEGTEIRYGGLYRELLRQESGIAILNYRGSTGIAKPDSISWRNTIEEDFDSLLVHLGEAKSVSLLGASFGGALALLLSKSRPVKKALLISPLLDLTHQRERGGEEFQSWFDSNFSSFDFHDISIASLALGLADLETPIALVYGAHDEVLGQEMFSWFRAVLSVNPNHKIHQHAGPHQPVSYQDVMSQLLWSFEFLMSPPTRPVSPPIGTRSSDEHFSSI